MRVTFGIKNANKKVRNNKSPCKGKDTAFFLTRDLSADAPADSKENKGEVNRGNRKKRVALHNRIFSVLHNLFLFSGPLCSMGKTYVSCSMPPSWVWECVCPVPLSRAVTIPACSTGAGEEWRSVGAQREKTEGGLSDQEWGLCPIGTGAEADFTRQHLGLHHVLWS